MKTLGATLIVLLTGCESLHANEQIPVDDEKAAARLQVAGKTLAEKEAVDEAVDEGVDEAAVTIADSSARGAVEEHSPERTIRLFFESDAFSTELGVLAQYIPKGVEILITGHTDSIGSTQYNLQLGLRRAQFVADGLHDAGIDRARMTVVSRGESEPAFSNDEVVGRAKNRRVEVLFAP